MRVDVPWVVCSTCEGVRRPFGPCFEFLVFGILEEMKKVL